MAEICHSCLAIPGKIIGFSPDDCNSAIIESLGIRRRIDVTLIQDSRPAVGDWVLIHVGFAMSKITQQDALDRLQTMELLEEKEAAIQEVCGYARADEVAVPESIGRRTQS